MAQCHGQRNEFVDNGSPHLHQRIDPRRKQAETSMAAAAAKIRAPLRALGSQSVRTTSPQVSAGPVLVSFLASRQHRGCDQLSIPMRLFCLRAHLPILRLVTVAARLGESPHGGSNSTTLTCIPVLTDITLLPCSACDPLIDLGPSIKSLHILLQPLAWSCHPSPSATLSSKHPANTTRFNNMPDNQQPVGLSLGLHLGIPSRRFSHFNRASPLEPLPLTA